MTAAPFEVFKLQRPIGDLSAPWLAYNADRSTLLEIPADWTQSLIPIIGARMKVYVWASLSPGKFVVEGEADAQTW